MMKIIVCIKQVPASQNIKIDPKTKNLNRMGIKGIINPFDKNAIEAALDIKDKTDAHVTVISMGPQQTKESLLEALAMGCDDAILLCSKSFSGADTLATAYVLSQCIKKCGDVDLIIFGRHAVDADTGQVGPIVAEFLDIPQATFVSSLTLLNDNSIQAVRLFEDGQEEVKVRLPAAITVTSELNTPRYATPINIMNVAKKEIKIYDEHNLNCDPQRIGIPGSPTIVTDVFVPEKRKQETQMLTGSPESVAKKIIDILQQTKSI